MNTRPGVGFDELPILVDLRDKLNEHYRAASRRPHESRLLRAHRWRPLALIVVLCLAGGTATLAATGGLQSTAPLAPSSPPALSAAPLAITAGIAIAGSVQVLPLRVRDRSGGAPVGWNVSAATAVKPRIATR
jgi:hypothetical protein